MDCSAPKVLVAIMTDSTSFARGVAESPFVERDARLLRVHTVHPLTPTHQSTHLFVRWTPLRLRRNQDLLSHRTSPMVHAQSSQIFHLHSSSLLASSPKNCSNLDPCSVVNFRPHKECVARRTAALNLRRVRAHRNDLGSVSCTCEGTFLPTTFFVSRSCFGFRGSTSIRYPHDAGHFPDDSLTLSKTAVTRR